MFHYYFQSNFLVLRVQTEKMIQSKYLHCLDTEAKKGIKSNHILITIFEKIIYFKRSVSCFFYFNIDIIRSLLKDSFLMGVKAKNHWNLPLLLTFLDYSTFCLSKKYFEFRCNFSFTVVGCQWVSHFIIAQKHVDWGVCDDRQNSIVWGQTERKEEQENEFSEWQD